MTIRRQFTDINPNPVQAGRPITPITYMARRQVIEYLADTSNIGVGEEITARKLSTLIRSDRATIALALRWLEFQGVIHRTGTYIPKKVAGRHRTQFGLTDHRQRPEIVYGFVPKSQVGVQRAKKAMGREIVMR